MTTPLLLLLLLAGPYLLLSAIERFGAGRFDRGLKGAAGLALVFLVTGVSHFTDTDSMAMMVPPVLPYPRVLIYFSGVAELSLAVALVLPRLRRPASIAAIVLLLVLLPANVYAAWNRVPMGGHAWGPVYLLVRVPLQATFIGWAYWFGVTSRRAARTGSPAS